MIKVITYGTYDLLHRGHIRLLERAKALGDYLIVGVTSDGFDKARGKINVKQSFLERIEGVRATGLADEIIVEEYEGQKIDDIRRYGADIFTVGSDWTGKFDYLTEYCKVIYLPRTEGISSSEIRANKQTVRLGLVGEGAVISKHKNECEFVNGIEVAGICTQNKNVELEFTSQNIFTTEHFDILLERVDAVYVASAPDFHFLQIRKALLNGKHVLCESPVALDKKELDQLICIADQQNLILMDAIKTAYSTAYYRLLLMLKSGCIGQIVSVDTTCTSLETPPYIRDAEAYQGWNSICAWGPVALLPIFQLLGTNYLEKSIASCFMDGANSFDLFTKIDFIFSDAVASLKIGKGVKSEGELIISGTKGYIYVPAPWWKTDYFEIRYENQTENRRHFYPLDGEGIRYELMNFVRAIETGNSNTYIERDVTRAITGIMADFYAGKNLRIIHLDWK